jgi:hypothetical protein
METQELVDLIRFCLKFYKAKFQKLKQIFDEKLDSLTADQVFYF